MIPKSIVLAFALAAGLPIVSAEAQDAYPTRTISIVVGYPGGTPVDTIARVIATKLTDRFGKPVIVENKPGAGSSIGAAFVAKAAPDGYTLYLSSIANTTNPAFNKLSFDFAEDLAPVSQVCDVPVLLVVPSSGPQSVTDLIAQAKAKPGDFSFGSSGTGTATHLFGELFAHETGTKLAHIPTKEARRPSSICSLAESKSCFHRQARCCRISNPVSCARSRYPDVTASPVCPTFRPSMKQASNISIFRCGSASTQRLECRNPS